MSDLLLLGGVALCALSVLWAVIQLARTEPPRAAAIMLVLGIALMFAGAFAQPDGFQPGDVMRAWQGVIGVTPA
ncbi:hypothetical protein MLD63_09635 [Paracoccus sp. TK19116]|uniref:Uncharacterized protein n=1 Tax=Paracoccus albicereus TaxID=2922394 RepID=A0ABT1MQU6_9RHOB|nr:hypothetical protein [Paracoccus albicereus]MCQ0970685.1 hypothetical protein [Paracoccus albicereus]